jgi:hypothetical protein
MLISTDRTF